MATTSLGFPLISGADQNVKHFDFVEALTGIAGTSLVNIADAEIVKRAVRHAMTSAEWAVSDIIMRAGELGYEIDTHKFKVGDGSSTYAQLSYPIQDGTMLADGSVPMAANLSLGGFKITNLAEPTEDTDAASKEYVDDVITIALVGNYIPTGQKGVANGVATLDANGKLTAAQKPAYTASEVGAVPVTRTVNGKELSADITLAPADIGAVANTISVNGKLLTSDVTLGAADIGFVSGDTGLSASTVQAAIAEVQANVEGVSDSVGALTPADIGALPEQTGTTGQFLGFTADNVVGAVANPVDGLTANNVGFTPGETGLEASNVQGAIEAVNTKIDSLTPDDVGAVPVTRTINGKELNADIALNAEDVGARSNTWLPSTSDINAVSNTTTVNGHPLNENVSLDAEDVGARANTWLPTTEDINAVPIERTVNGKALSDNVSISAGDIPFVPGSTGLESATVQAALEEIVGDNTLQGITTRGASTSNAVEFSNTTASTSTTTGAVTIAGGLGVAGDIWADQVFGAVWNDYAEYREASGEFAPGDCVCEDELGILSKSTKRLQKNAHIVSDTFGFAIGKTDEEQCPIALTGRVLASVTGHQLDYSVGDVVCAGADGKITKMRWWEKVLFPDRMIGVVSKIPDSNEWGKGIKVNDRVWVNIF